MSNLLRRLIRYSPTALIFAFLVGMYVYLTDSKMVNPYLFPNKEAIYSAFIQNRASLLGHMLASFKLLIPSVLLALLLALGIGSVMGLNKKIRTIFYPVIYAFSVVPAILLSPFVLLLAPTLYSASIFLIVYNILWATLFSTITGIEAIDKRYLDKAETLELSWFDRFFRVVLPAASPAILGGLVNSLRSSFVMLVFAEMYGAGEGMGYFVKKYAELGIFANTWVGFIFMVLVLVIVMQLFELLKQRLLRWTN